MFERVFKRLGHGSVVEKKSRKKKSRKNKRKKKQKRERVRVLLLLWGFLLLLFFFFKIRNRFVGRRGHVREVGRIEIEGNGEDRNGRYKQNTRRATRFNV